MGCRRRAPQAELVRVVRLPDGSLGTGRTPPGRGAWLCRESAACLERALRRGGLERALHAKVPAGAAVVLARQMGIADDVRG